MTEDCLALDEDLCVSLADVLRAFNAAINEEQSWSLCHQMIHCLSLHFEPLHSLLLLHPHHLFIRKDGSIHPKSLTIDQECRARALHRKQMIASLGVVLFRALDFGLREDEERTLSSPLERLIDTLTSADPSVADYSEDESRDEGIECDQNCGPNSCVITFDDVTEMCARRLSEPESADLHYKNVLRALVTETLELSQFLDQIARGSKVVVEGGASQTHEKPLDTIPLHDWARLWVQVIKQLREGVLLRKVSEREAPPLLEEFELTPFEMLLADIRLKRYQLNHVTPESRVRKDAHQLILDFIRSRPPLQPVSERRLKPLPREEKTLYEKLMQSIRQKDAKLKPTLITQTSRASSARDLREHVLCEDSVRESTPSNTRRLIKADLHLKLSLSDEEEEESQEIQRKANEEKEKTTERHFSLKNLSLRLLTHDSRRHSISACESPLDLNEDTRSHVESIWAESAWGRALDCLSLTLEEVQHIRSVLTKAEMETLSVTPEIRSDLENGRICFTCLKTRFSFWSGNWPKSCKVCERAICDRCATRMHIPCQEFEKVPIYMLSPTPSPPEEHPPHKPQKRSLLLRALTHRDSSDGDSSDCHSKGPEVRVCRDCKTLVRHLIDSGRTERFL